MKTLGANGKVDLSGETVAVAFDENRLTLTAIMEAIEEQGYDVSNETESE